MNLLGIDYGTTSVKAALFDDKLNQLASSVEDYTLYTKGNIVEFEADKYVEMLHKIIGEIRSTSRVDALAIDTQCETLILTDENDTPVRNAIVWLDNRATKEAEIIEAHFGRQKIYEITGQPEVTATWPACKLLWIKHNEPDVWKKTKKIFLLEDYLLYKLTGKFVTEKTLQSSSLYFDINSGNWWSEMLDFLGVDAAMLPELYSSGKTIGTYDGITVSTSAMDQVAGAIGAGVISKGTVSAMTGTTMAIFLPTDEVPPFDADSIVPCHYNYDDSYCLLSWSSTAGMALKWFRDSFLADKSFSELGDMASQIPYGSDGVVFLPYLCGSTMPKYNPDARGSFTGITPEHTTAHFVRSIMESIACILKSNLDYLGVPVDEIRAMGGGAQSPIWCSMKADITGKTLVTLKNKETACLGSAILAGVGAGCYESVKQACSMIQTDKVYAPDENYQSDVYEQFCKYDNILNIRRNK
ncbi:MAG: hypothetical protein IKA95_02505 [Clostridia bacterium]|nr:hypothetical protein [Clostridia bacterium]